MYIEINFSRKPLLLSGNLHQFAVARSATLYLSTIGASSFREKSERI